MALRPDRLILETDAYHVLNDVAEKGVGLVYQYQGSGASLGANQGTVHLATSPSGLRVAGMLLQDFVNVDETRFHINWHKEEQEIGDNCDMGVKGWVVTNQVTGSTPTEGDKAYITANGQFTKTVSATGGTVATPLFGEFGGNPDELGYIKIKFNLPNGQ